MVARGLHPLRARRATGVAARRGRLSPSPSTWPAMQPVRGARWSPGTPGSETSFTPSTRPRRVRRGGDESGTRLLDWDATVERSFRPLACEDLWVHDLVGDGRGTRSVDPPGSRALRCPGPAPRHLARQGAGRRPGGLAPFVPRRSRPGRRSRLPLRPPLRVGAPEGLLRFVGSGRRRPAPGRDEELDVTLDLPRRLRTSSASPPRSSRTGARPCAPRSSSAVATSPRPPGPPRAAHLGDAGGGGEPAS